MARTASHRCLSFVDFVSPEQVKAPLKRVVGAQASGKRECKFVRRIHLYIGGECRHHPSVASPKTLHVDVTPLVSSSEPSAVAQVSDRHVVLEVGASPRDVHKKTRYPTVHVGERRRLRE